MNTCLKLLVAALLVWKSCEAQRFIPGEAVNAPVQLSALIVRNAEPSSSSDPSGGSTAANTPTDCVGKFGPVCDNCHTLVTCANTKINTQTCASIDPTKPYCNGKACTASYDGTCAMPFRCTAKGIFPNPSDCSSYFFCTEATASGSIMYKCPTNYVFDSKLVMCKQRKTAADCVTVTCTGKENKYQILPSDKSIMAYCVDTPALKETILFRCPDYQNMEYDAETQECQFVCRAEGRFVDRQDCKKFYECYKIGTAFSFNHLACPASFKFNPLTKACDFGTCTNEIA